MENPVSLLKMFFVVVFVGWLLIWVMMPTKYYKTIWLPKFAQNLNTTYFGPQGTYLMLLTVPMMLIAILSCVYLHFQKISRKSDDNSKRTKKKKTEQGVLGCLKRPVLVTNHLGIVTGLEAVFGFLFIALLIWSLAHYLHVSFGKLHMHGDTVWQARFRSVWLRVGYIGHICWAFLFFPVTRGSSILPLVGLTSESSIKYHIWLGHLSNFLFLLHTIGFIIYWAITGQLIEMLEWNPTYVSNVAGEIAMAIGIGMWVTSIRSVRRKLYEVFYYTHQLYGLYILFYVIHVGDSWFCMILPNIFLFFIDRYLRFLQSQTRSRLLSSRILPSNSIELTFSKTPELQYNPTSIMFIHVPSISKLQWHPFTVTSNCNLEPETITVVIKSMGSWTQKLYKEISSPIQSLQVSTEGPYGPKSFHLLRHESIILVSGGSGITPMSSIIREIISLNRNQTINLPNILLISAFKHYEDLAFLDLLFPASGVSESEISKLNLKIEVYITKENEEPKTEDGNTKLLQTKIFIPNPHDKPVSPVLGPNNLLWLGAIILSSFSMFLLLIGIVTRYYIYPVDKNTGKIYNFTYRTLWDMFLGCVCIFVASSVVFLWCKKQNAMTEKKQVENVDLQTPTASPGSWFVAAGREVESVPFQSVVQATNIHFGSRPNLKKILLDVQGSDDVGVMVCGPRKMRHEVAKICASGLAKNLHFESLSFTI